MESPPRLLSHRSAAWNDNAGKGRPDSPDNFLPNCRYRRYRDQNRCAQTTTIAAWRPYHAWVCFAAVRSQPYNPVPLGEARGKVCQLEPGTGVLDRGLKWNSCMHSTLMCWQHSLDRNECASDRKPHLGSRSINIYTVL